MPIFLVASLHEELFNNSLEAISQWVTIIFILSRIPYEFGGI